MSKQIPENNTALAPYFLVYKSSPDSILVYDPIKDGPLKFYVKSSEWTVKDVRGWEIIDVTENNLGVLLDQPTKENKKFTEIAAKLAAKYQAKRLYTVPPKAEEDD